MLSGVQPSASAPSAPPTGPSNPDDQPPSYDQVVAGRSNPDASNTSGPLKPGLTGPDAEDELPSYNQVLGDIVDRSENTNTDR